MKAIIEIKPDSQNTGIWFMKGRTNITWDDLSREEQVAILNEMLGFYDLFVGCVKPEPS